MAFICMLAGGIIGILIELLGTFVEVPILPLIPVILFGFGLGITFIALFLVSLVITVVCSFLRDKKKA